MLSGDNGILQKATAAKENTDNSQIVEKVQLAYTAALADGNGELTESNLRLELTNEFGNEYDLIKDSATNEWVISVNEIERLRLNAGMKSKSVEIAYTITKNTIKINFKPNIQAYEELVVKVMKNNARDYIESQFPGQEITISLIYQLWEVNSLEEAATKFNFPSIQAMLIDMGYTQEEIDNIRDVTGKITLKKGDTVIVEGNVSLNNWLEYTLTESGTYTIQGESSEGGKDTKNIQHEYAIKYGLQDDGVTFITEPGEGLYPTDNKSYQPYVHNNGGWSRFGTDEESEFMIFTDNWTYYSYDINGHAFDYCGPKTSD